MDEVTTHVLQRSLVWGLDLSQSPQGAGGVGGLLSVVESGATTRYYPAFDGNGNVSEYVNQGGDEVAHFEYDPFGNLTVDDASNAAAFPYRFSTKPQDSETGLYYYGYRYYDLVTGRWPSWDPIEEEGGANLYGFVGNNSIWHVDFVGLFVAVQGDDKSAEAYRKSITDCLKRICCNAIYEWVRDDDYHPKPRKIDVFTKDGPWFKLVVKKRNGGFGDICENLEKAIGDNKLRYLSPTGANGARDESGAEASAEGNIRPVIISPTVDIPIPVQHLDGQGKHKHDKDGKPMYVTQSQGFCSTLWHELVGHAVNGDRRHDDEAWNDYEERDKRTPGWGKSDPSIQEENRARAAMELPLRRPQYWDKENPRPAKN